MQLSQFSTQIEKTGFVLENRVAQQLKAAKWTVISNRYYVDDAEESVREIDLVAYKATRVQHFDVYTTLLISCKKNESNAWALLSREIDLKDPNSDWQPLHAWSNDKALAFQLSVPGVAKLYHDAAEQSGAGAVFRTPEVEVFAFQEMNKVSGTPQNDKAIFQAVTSLMKSQAYELGALPQRKRTPAVYQFNLLSLVDSDLVRINFSTGLANAEAIDQEHYIARYIIKKKETFSRIRFLKANVFEKLIPEYSELHTANCAWFDAQCHAFYADILQDEKRSQELLTEFRQVISWPFRLALQEQGINVPESKSICFSWSKTNNMVIIYAPVGGEGAMALNKDSSFRSKVSAALSKIFRYNGDFMFQDDIPF
ncbi:conserved hypothetical protein [Limnobacter sp. 130]|uniref:hypothetical protein n=1 Tax=Limnobacter sp. 130 TaxID=2653147 RepID=UPI0012F0E220|nr:hypothetical protein [Limnobacter sp. 130]VWX33700.1 conserved hypothetical protein [Limnobacter sp. 130]